MSRVNASSLPFGTDFFFASTCYVVRCGKADFNLLIESTVVTSDLEMGFQVTHFLMGKNLTFFSLLMLFLRMTSGCKAWSPFVMFNRCLEAT